MGFNPDLVYLRSREDLLQYEDSRLNSLLNGLANFYTTRNDQSLWGNILRAYSIELGKVEYFYAYDLVNKEPQFLTPSDIKRRWSGPLFVSSNYPTDTQSDQDYRTMLVNLLTAYKEGATVQAIQDAIFAYTGKNIIVGELFKQIGTFFDQSDRNSITVSVNVGGTNPLADIQNLNELQAVTRDLYGAIDLTKPAHVGINLSTIFGTDENIDAFITGINDQLRIFVKLIEAEPSNPMLIQAPVLNPTNPMTTIAAFGRRFLPVLTVAQYNALVEPSLALWQANHVYHLGDQILDPNFNIQTVTTADTSGGTIPTFTQALSGITADGPTLKWTNTAPTAKAAYTLQSQSGNYVIKDVARNWIMLEDANNNLTGFLANFDPNHPAGLVAPHLNRAWEVSGGDQPFIFELT